MSLQVFNYQNNPITFSKDADVMINATEMAKPFGKKPTHFLANAQTKGFILALRDRVNFSELVTITHGDNGGTWMHQKLALKFAAWLSPEFELWVYDRIEELLLTGKTEVRTKSESEKILEGYQLLLGQVEQVKEQNRLLEITIKEQAPKVEYCMKVLDSHSDITTTVIAKELGMSAVELNRKLKALGIHYNQSGTWVLKAKYQDKGYTLSRTTTYTDALGYSRTSILTTWTEKGRMFLHDLIRTQTAA